MFMAKLFKIVTLGCKVNQYESAYLEESLIEAGGGCRVQDREELYERMKTLLSDPVHRDEMGGLAKEFVERNRGALGRVVSFIADSL